jgi:hypothetical protein
MPISSVPTLAKMNTKKLGIVYNLFDGVIYICGAKKVANAQMLQREEVEHANNMKCGFQSILGALRRNRSQYGYTEIEDDFLLALLQRKKGQPTKFDDFFNGLPENYRKAFDEGISRKELRWFRDVIKEDAKSNQLQRELKSPAYEAVNRSEKHWRKVDGKASYWFPDSASAAKVCMGYGTRADMNSWRIRSMLKTEGIVSALMREPDFLYPDSSAKGERAR